MSWNLSMWSWEELGFLKTPTPVRLAGWVSLLLLAVYLIMEKTCESLICPRHRHPQLCIAVGKEILWVLGREDFPSVTNLFKLGWGTMCGSTTPRSQKTHKCELVPWVLHRMWQDQNSPDPLCPVQMGRDMLSMVASGCQQAPENPEAGAPAQPFCHPAGDGSFISPDLIYLGPF